MTLTLPPYLDAPPRIERRTDFSSLADATASVGVGYYYVPALMSDAFADFERAINRMTARVDMDANTFRCVQEAARLVVRRLARAGHEPACVRLTSEGGIAIHFKTPAPERIAMIDCGPYGLAAMLSDRATGAVDTWDLEARADDIDHTILKIWGAVGK